MSRRVRAGWSSRMSRRLLAVLCPLHADQISRRSRSGPAVAGARDDAYHDPLRTCARPAPRAHPTSSSSYNDVRCPGPAKH